MTELQIHFVNFYLNLLNANSSICWRNTEERTLLRFQ